MRWRRNHRALKRAVDQAADALLSARVDRDIVANCHAAKLVLEGDIEKRIRSIQTLAHLKHNMAIAPLVREIVTVSASWPGNRGTAWTEKQMVVLLQAMGDLVVPLLQSIDSGEEST